MNDDPTLRNRLRDAGTGPTDEFRTRLRHRLEHELAGNTVVEPAVSTPASPPRRTWRWIASAAAVAVVLVAVVVLRTPDDTAAPSDATTNSAASPSDTTSPTPSSDASLLATLTSSRWILVDADSLPIPFPVPHLTPLPPGANALVGTFDGCNGGSIDGVIEDGRLRITETTSTSVGCPDVQPITLPSESALLLTDDGRTLTVTLPSGAGPMLTFRREDSLGDPVQRDQLIGWWSGGDAVAASFTADGRLTAGTCSRTWTLEDSGILYLYGSSTDVVDESCPPRFLAATANGPFTAQLDDTGALWLLALDQQTVLRLDPTDEPAPEPIVRWLPAPPIDLAPRLFPIDDLEPCDPGRCRSIAVAPDGTIVSYHAADHTINVGRRSTGGDLPARTVPIDGPAPVAGYLIGIGPDDVAYLVVEPADAVDPIGDVIAVPLSGPSAGDVVAEAIGVAELSGDSSFVASRTGWVSVGCCGFDPISPDPERAPLLGWVDRSGAPITLDGPVFSMEHSGDTVTFVRTEADGTRAAWDLPAEQTRGMRDMPLAAMPDGGEVIVSWWNVADTDQRLLRLHADGGAEEILVPSDLSIVTLTPFGAAIVYDGATYQFWQLPGFASPTDATAHIAELAGPGPFATPDDLIDTLLRALSAPDGCEVAPTATVIDRTDDPDVVVTVAARYGCDDSGAGADITVALRQESDGSWAVAAARSRGLCIRGASGEFCV